MTGRWIIADRVGTGTCHLGRQCTAWLTAPGLTGRPRVRAVAGRTTTLLAVTWFVGGMLYALGMPPWGLVPVWLGSAIAASYRAALVQPPATEAEPPGAPQPTAAPAARLWGPERAILLDALEEITRGKSGAHLWPTVYEGLRTARPGQYGELDDKHLRALLDLHQVPVKQITAGGIRGRKGISRADIEALLAPTPPPAEAPIAAEEDAPDLRKSSSSPKREVVPEGVACTPHELGDDTLAMLHGKVTGR